MQTKINNSSILSMNSAARAVITNQKSVSELVIIVRNEFRDCIFMPSGYAGMCDCIHTLFQQKVISGIEYSKIYNFLLENRPENTKDRTAYWWKVYDKEPRLEFLNSLIKVDFN